MSIQCKRCNWISCKEGHKDGMCKPCVDELKVKDLERQLEEAREEAKRERKERFWLWYAIGFCLDNKKIAEVREIFKEQLKEKGE